MIAVLERDNALAFDLLPIDSEALLQPIVGDQGPAGPFLLYEDVYDQIRTARQADNPILPQGIWETSLKRADWDEVIGLAANTLCHQSKDLQLAAWLVEAAVQRHGFAGLAEAVAITQTLARTFWADLHPRIDAGDLAARLAPIEWMCTKLPPTLRLVTLTQSGPNDDHVYCLADWDAARRESEADDAVPMRTKIRAALQASDLDWRQSTARAVRDSLTQLQLLASCLDEQCDGE
ncbi:MAG: type VI secretion system protein TssA, partial [Pseudomonadota bacterium]